VLARDVLATTGSTVSRLAATVMVIAILYFAREVLIPFALSVLLCFFLAPLVSRLRRWHLGRVPAAALTVVLATGFVFAVGSYFVVQVIDVTRRMPEYQSNIENKISSLRIVPDGPMDRVIRMFVRLNAGVSDAIDSAAPTEAPGPRYRHVRPPKGRWE